MTIYTKDDMLPDEPKRGDIYHSANGDWTWAGKRWVPLKEQETPPAFIYNMHVDASDYTIIKKAELAQLRVDLDSKINEAAWLRREWAAQLDELRELRAAIIAHATEAVEYADIPACIWCGNDADNNAGVISHKPDCLWLRLSSLPDGASDESRR